MSLESVLQNLVDAVNGNTEALLRSRNETPAVAEQPVADTTVHVTKPKKTPAAKKVEEEAIEPPADVKKEIAEAEGFVELTIDDVRKRLTPIIQKHSPAVVQTSLGKLGVDKLSALKPEQYQELLDVVATETGEEV